MKKAYVLFALPYVVMLLGTICNQAAVHANGGHMPVLFPGHTCMPDLVLNDPVHVCMVPAHHLKFLGDWMISSSRVTSIGDYLIDFASDVRIPSCIVSAALVVQDIFKK